MNPGSARGLEEGAQVGERELQSHGDQIRPQIIGLINASSVITERR